MRSKHTGRIDTGFRCEINGMQICPVKCPETRTGVMYCDVQAYRRTRSSQSEGIAKIDK